MVIQKNIYSPDNKGVVEAMKNRIKLEKVNID